MNSLRHGEPELVRIELSDGDGVRMRISDDGSGFDPVAEESRRSGFGLISMKEKAKALGGTFRLSSQPGKGADVVVEVPQVALDEV